MHSKKSTKKSEKSPIFLPKSSINDPLITHQSKTGQSFIELFGRKMGLFGRKIGLFGRKIGLFGRKIGLFSDVSCFRLISRNQGTTSRGASNYTFRKEPFIF